MDPETKQILRRQTELLQENNKILKKLNRAQNWSSFLTFLKWVVVILISVFVYITLAPVLEALMQTYAELAESAEQVKDSTANLPDVSGLVDFFKKDN